MWRASESVTGLRGCCCQRTQVDANSTPPDVAAFKTRYKTVSTKDRELCVSILESGFGESLSERLRQAKTNYMIGNYVGVVARCGIVAEKVAIVIHAMNAADEEKRDEFEKLGQVRRSKTGDC